MTKIFCVVCKHQITVKDEREFRALGHFVDQAEGKHLLKPNLGKSTRRHNKAVKADEDRQIRIAEIRRIPKEEVEA